MSSNQIKTQTKLKSMHRRQFGRVAVGVLAVTGLVACGGGGGDGSEDDEYPLRAAYDRISNGMTKEEVLAIVGREPEGKSKGSWSYRSAEENLMVWFGLHDGSSVWTVDGVNWDTVRRVPALSLAK